MNKFVHDWLKNAEHLTVNHAYHPSQEHDACGVGMIAAIDGKPRRQVVEAGIEALKSVWHRGAVDADGKTGDGAGIHVQIPQDFFKEHVRRTGHEVGRGRLAVGMVFSAAHRACGTGALPVDRRERNPTCWSYDLWLATGSGEC